MNLKRILLTIALFGCIWGCNHLSAVPALRQAYYLMQPDGTKIQVRQMGDEFMSFITDAQSGNCLTQDEQTGFWREMTDKEISLASEKWAQSRRLAKAANARRNIGGTPRKNQVRIPVLLVEYSDLKLTKEYGTQVYYDTLLNYMKEERFAFKGNDGKDYYTGSVRQYFRDQSLGKFDPIFDILKPITLSKDFAYYGADGTSGHDAHCGELIQEAVNKAIEQGDLRNAKQYDSDNNGQIDLLYIVFAGCGQNQGADANTIWPHTSSMSIRTTDGTNVNIFCMTSELRGSDPSKKLSDDIGVFVHEMSHALGLPDFYATSSATAANCYGMDAWSLMDQGEYNGLNKFPSPYTLHERMEFEWCDEPEPVPTVGKVILEPIALNGKGLILRNPDSSNEYLTFENHQKDASIWDRMWGTSNYALGSINNGLLITHVDYSKSLWNSNGVNNDASHQRCAPLAADGEKLLFKTVKDKESYSAFISNVCGDIYPGLKKITTLNSGNPLACWHTGDIIDINITNIVQLPDGNIEITFGEPEPDSIEDLEIENEHTPAKIEFRNGRFMIKGYDLDGKASLYLR